MTQAAITTGIRAGKPPLRSSLRRTRSGKVARELRGRCSFWLSVSAYLLMVVSLAESHVEQVYSVVQVCDSCDD